MNYIKLIAINIGDFYSVIEFEQNYSIGESDTYNSKKKELEANGLICILANVGTNFVI